MTHNERRDWVGLAMRAKGFHDTDEGFAERGMVRAALAMTEACEVMQEVKRFWGKAGVDQEGVMDHIAEECADTAIRVYDLCFLAGIDLDVELTVERFRPLGADDRRRLIIQCGRMNGDLYMLLGTFEDCHDSADATDEERAFRDPGFGLAEDAALYASEALEKLDGICKFVGRSLNAAIDAKMAVNMNRPHKYGTPEEGGGATARHPTTPAV